jgi:hypothetical protein
MKTVDFFQSEATRCRGNAKIATNRDDREFWLNMANRWETMQRKREPPRLRLGPLSIPALLSEDDRLAHDCAAGLNASADMLELPLRPSRDPIRPD